MRWLALLLLCNCGLFIDGVYLISDKHTTKSEEQRRPTGEQQTKPELALTFDGPRLKVSCEQVTHSIDRVWSVEKVYEYQGGFPQVHWLPVVLNGAIGTGLAIGFSVKCADPTSGFSCDSLYATIPLGVDFAYSLIRLLTIEPPKLVDKKTTMAHVENNGSVLQRESVACSPGTVIVAGKVTAGVDANGYVTAQAQQRLEQAMLDLYAVATAVSGERRSTDLDRCAFWAMKPGAVLPSGCVR